MSPEDVPSYGQYATGVEESLATLRNAREKPEMRARAAYNLYESRGERGRAVLFSIISDETEDPVTRSFAAGTLYDEEEADAVEPDPDAVEPLVRALLSSEPRLRGVAAAALYVHGDERAVQPLLDAMKSASGHDLHSIIGALGKLRDRRAVGPLVEILEAQPRQGKVTAFEAFVQRLVMRNVYSGGWDAAMAASALGKIGDRQAVEPLVRALQSSYSNVRDSAARALGEIGDKEALTALQWAVENDSGRVYERRVSDTAAEAVRRITGQPEK